MIQIYNVSIVQDKINNISMDNVATITTILVYKQVNVFSEFSFIHQYHYDLVDSCQVKALEYGGSSFCWSCLFFFVLFFGGMIKNIC
jgi:hypothetical protein